MFTTLRSRSRRRLTAEPAEHAEIAFATGGRQRRPLALNETDRTRKQAGLSFCLRVRPVLFSVRRFAARSRTPVGVRSFVSFVFESFLKALLRELCRTDAHLVTRCISNGFPSCFRGCVFKRFCYRTSNGSFGCGLGRAVGSASSAVAFGI